MLKAPPATKAAGAYRSVVFLGSRRPLTCQGQLWGTSPARGLTAKGLAARPPVSASSACATQGYRDAGPPPPMGTPDPGTDPGGGTPSHHRDATHPAPQVVGRQRGGPRRAAPVASSLAPPERHHVGAGDLHLRLELVHVQRHGIEVADRPCVEPLLHDRHGQFCARVVDLLAAVEREARVPVHHRPAPPVALHRVEHGLRGPDVLHRHERLRHVRYAEADEPGGCIIGVAVELQAVGHEVQAGVGARHFELSRRVRARERAINLLARAVREAPGRRRRRGSFAGLACQLDPIAWHLVQLPHAEPAAPVDAVACRPEIVPRGLRRAASDRGDPFAAGRSSAARHGAGSRAGRAPGRGPRHARRSRRRPPRAAR